MDIKERDQFIKDMAAGGMSYREIGRRFGITYERVRQIVQDKKAPGVITENKKFYEAALNYVKVAVVNGLNENQISNTLGIKPRQARYLVSQVKG